MNINLATIEEINATRFNLESEYKALKAYLLQKINRMEEIEKNIKEIDTELKKRTKNK